MLSLFHTSHQIIKQPDVHFGRSNADFGQGFYLSDSHEFAGKWATPGKDGFTYINCYTLEPDGLKVKSFDISSEWFEYIKANREGRRDSLSDFDVVIGPVANDTLFDTYGILTSGLIKPEDALKLLSVGKNYRQINIKSKAAAAKLKWLKSERLEREELEKSRELLLKESEQYTELFFGELMKLPDFADIEDMLT
ncbi:MAG: DUF3990 domain-containing protein [Clostridia bacterium]|nr:DUF3990 domain-containing protein [Clostridia bacterium]